MSLLAARPVLWYNAVSFAQRGKGKDAQMTLQQLKYAVEVADKGSITEAAKSLFIAQPSLSAAIRDLEEETGTTLFMRNSRGVLITPEGAEFLSHARQLVQQAALIEDKYITHSAVKQRFSVSTQHYSFTFQRVCDARSHLRRGRLRIHPARGQDV